MSFAGVDSGFWWWWLQFLGRRLVAMADSSSGGHGLVVMADSSSDGHGLVVAWTDLPCLVPSQP